MREFKEFLIEDTMAEQTVYMPSESEIVGVNKTDHGVFLLAIVPAAGYGETVPEIRNFKICLLGENFSYPIVKYIGSFDSIIGNKYVVEVRKERC